MEEEWKQLFRENGIKRVEYDDDDHSDYSSSDDTAASHSCSGNAPQNQIKSLSKFYQGKSQSYKSLSDITSINDLAKKMIGLIFWEGNKPGSSYAQGSDAAETQKPCDKPMQSNKSITSYCASSTTTTGSKPPIPMRKNI